MSLPQPNRCSSPGDDGGRGRGRLRLTLQLEVAGDAVPRVEGEQLAQDGRQLGPGYDEVDHAVIPEEFRRLKSLRQRLVVSLLDDARAREADHGAALGNENG